MKILLTIAVIYSFILLANAQNKIDTLDSTVLRLTNKVTSLYDDTNRSIDRQYKIVKLVTKIADCTYSNLEPEIIKTLKTDFKEEYVDTAYQNTVAEDDYQDDDLKIK